MEDERKSSRMREMERLHTQGGEAVGERRQGGEEDAVVVEETTRVPVYCPCSK